MALRLDSIAVAEGVATDSRGALTLVGYNLPGFPAEGLPFSFSPYVIVIVEDGGEGARLTPGVVIKATIAVSDPNGQVVFLAQNQQAVQPAQQALQAVAAVELPQRLQFIAQAPFTANKAGSYKVAVTLEAGQDDAQKILAERLIRVVDSTLIKQQQLTG